MDVLNSTAFSLRDSIFDTLVSIKTSDPDFSRTTMKATLLANKTIICLVLIAYLFVYLILSVFTVPAHLRHLPCVPIFPLLKSYLTGEVEDTRIRRLVLPFANDRKEGVVLVWALGRWMVHILDEKVHPPLFPQMRLI